MVLADLAWEIVRANLTRNQLDCLPFAPTTLGVAPAAALAGAIGVLVLTRAQYATVTMPWLAGHGSGWVNSDDAFRWALSLSNAGAGLARIERVGYQITWNSTFDDTEPPLFSSAEECRSAFTQRGYVSGSDFSMAEISPGHPLRPQTDRDAALELFWIAPTTMTGLRCCRVRIRFDDLLGDTYEWSRDLLPVMTLGFPPPVQISIPQKPTYATDKNSIVQRLLDLLRRKLREP